MSEIILNEKLNADDLISGISNHGYLVPLTGKTIQDLVDGLNEIKTPYAIKFVVYGDGRFHAILELDKKVRKIKKTNKKGNR